MRIVWSSTRSTDSSGRSNSSSISPTISSRRSSSVTMPAIVPYSSTTTDMWKFSRRKSASSEARSFVSGTMYAGLSSDSMSMFAKPRSFRAENRFRTCRMPTMSSSVSRRFEPERPEDQLGRALEDPDQRMGDPEEAADGRRDAERDRLRVAERGAFRHQLADDDVQVGDDQEGEHDGEEGRHQGVEGA